jgi:hypothetical protein
MKAGKLVSSEPGAAQAEFESNSQSLLPLAHFLAQGNQIVNEINCSLQRDQRFLLPFALGLRHSSRRACA